MIQVVFDFQSVDRAVSAWNMIDRMPLLVLCRRGSTLVVRGREQEILAAVERFERRFAHFPDIITALQLQFAEALQREIIIS